MVIESNVLTQGRGCCLCNAGCWVMKHESSVYCGLSSYNIVISHCTASFLSSNFCVVCLFVYSFQTNALTSTSTVESATYQEVSSDLPSSAGAKASIDYDDGIYLRPVEARIDPAAPGIVFLSLSSLLLHFIITACAASHSSSCPVFALLSNLFC